MPTKLDAIDRKILTALQRDGRLQNIELARQAGLSPSPCLRRVRNLEASGVIDHYAAMLGRDAVGLPLVIFCRVTLHGQNKKDVMHFADEISRLPEVLECYLMAGTYDYLLKVACADLEDYQRFQMDHLTPMPGVRNVVTEIPLKEVKVTTELPVSNVRS